ncbi:hypothetical protein P8C59_001060 [Phyllachora maydis]|uniref:JmjC domain-containing protein n=1 Tax=Phyllachora maydis TaxID=1825666 RepID=A0AAD9M8K3_9PEZI|nr:hypothetical protein P8C59_001060 [Phyllachora maydis]
MHGARWYGQENETGEKNTIVPCRPSRRGLSIISIIHADHPFAYELTVFPENSSAGIGNRDALRTFIHWLAASTNDGHPGLAALLQEALGQHSIDLDADPPPDQPRFLRFRAPLALLQAGLQHNEGRAQFHGRAAAPLTGLYIAQSSLDELPPPLRRDVPVPALLNRPDVNVYGSSVWLGLEPTYSPWHRDPNPNLLVQLCGRKEVRLLPPRAGEDLKRRALLAGRGGGQLLGLRMAGPETMEGRQREALHEAVWSGPAGTTTTTITKLKIAPGDGLYVPQGWWHSVRSEASMGELNASDDLYLDSLSE